MTLTDKQLRRVIWFLLGIIKALPGGYAALGRAALSDPDICKILLEHK